MYHCPRCGQDNTTSQDFVQRSINVSNLHATITASHLFSMFNQVGTVVCAFMLNEVTATDGSQSGVVQYNVEEKAAEAVVRCDGFELMGRPMKVSYSGQDIKCVQPHVWWHEVIVCLVQAGVWRLRCAPRTNRLPPVRNHALCTKIDQCQQSSRGHHWRHAVPAIHPNRRG